MANFNGALDKLIQGFEGFTEELRNIAEDLPQDRIVGAGEEPDDNMVNFAAAPGAREDIDDATTITMKSGDLRQVLNAYRKLTRYAREGRIPTQDERVELHQHIRKVKHLVRMPHHH